ncbi:Protein of unknown function DUF1183 TMEM66 [Penicillium alfredii]|uniref:Store-operated calcium entry-associated regulatory factor n=1 Tax=Penicillium alfredii TaxID=1506179 RepID=A0A9W9F2N0_9EURO|nr:Protein of unknown function DUF1183 TMEM66 [Penicillium alfredii]KAJ5092350.1 Protein of unknown function DUF1183 TMEM66 [Penicillium alfredii]
MLQQMRSLSVVALAALLFLSPVSCTTSSQKPPGENAILLSKVQTLTLRGNRMTSSRRVSPIPQLKCIGPSKKVCDLYPIETMRCTNQGYDYDEEDVQWTCTASLPPELKLGATDVVCEGYRNADDKWVLKGSCGVEYRLLLTEKGEERFGKAYGNSDWSLGNLGRKVSGDGYRKVLAILGDLIFFGFVAVVFVLVLWPMLADCFGLRRGQRRRGMGRRPGGFWGGGDDDDYPGPPPPYSRYADSYKPAFGGRQSGQGWGPGFWTGALGGAAAGYGIGRRAGSGNGSSQRGASFGGFNGSDPGEGSSRSAPQFSSTTSSTGFGSTRRR